MLNIIMHTFLFNCLDTYKTFFIFITFFNKIFVNKIKDLFILVKTKKAKIQNYYIITTHKTLFPQNLSLHLKSPQ